MATYENAHHRAMIENINWNIAHLKELYPSYSVGEVSDTYHTFNELYDHRARLFAMACNIHQLFAWKSKLHADGTMYDGMFIVGIDTPDGQATYHYNIDPYWDIFHVQELPHAPKWDGHTPEDAIRRIDSLTAVTMRSFVPYFKIRNEFTEACDEFLLDEWRTSPEDQWLGTEIHVDMNTHAIQGRIVCPFRFPGATRGSISVDVASNKIVDVVLYDAATDDMVGCYRKEIKTEIPKRFIGHVFKGDSGFLLRAIYGGPDNVYYDSCIRYDPSKEE